MTGYYIGYSNNKVCAYKTAEDAFRAIADKTTSEELPVMLPNRAFALSHSVGGDETRMIDAERYVTTAEEWANFWV